MSLKKKKILDLIVVGSGIAGLNFIDKYLEKNKKINVIAPSINKILKPELNQTIKVLPSQMRGSYKNVENFYYANNIKLKNNCKAIGSLSFGGLSSYWGLQMNNYINCDQKFLKKKNIRSIEKYFIEFLKKTNLLGEAKFGKKKTYKNNFNIPEELNNLNKIKDKDFECRKPILAFMCKKNFGGDLNKLNEKKQKLTAENFYKKIKKKNNIIFHNCYLQQINKKKNLIELTCIKKKKGKKFLVKKIVFATGTIATTKILMNYLNIKNEVKIKHHPRLLSVFLSKKKFNYNLGFTPSLLQIISKSTQDYFTADLRPGNKLITKSIIDSFPFMAPLKYLINFLRNRLIFSNILLDSSHSNLYLKKNNDKFDLFSKKEETKSVLKKRNKKIFNFLVKKKIIYPLLYKTFYPGNGADYHYFGSIPFKNKGKLAVNNNCQLNSSKNIYVIDGSVFDFKKNKYPLGIVAANARRIAKQLSK